MKTVSELLIEAARRYPPSDCVPDHFAQRFMVHLARHPHRRREPDRSVDDWRIWTRTFFRAAGSGAFVAALLSVSLLMMAPQNFDDMNDWGVSSDPVNSTVDDSGGEIW